jgi:hypothetical protein
MSHILNDERWLKQVEDEHLRNRSEETLAGRKLLIALSAKEEHMLRVSGSHLRRAHCARVRLPTPVRVY